MSLPPLTKFRVTRWSPSDELVETRDCRMCYRHWLQQESIRRMEKSMQDAWIETNLETGEVALFVWKQSGIVNIQPEEEV